MSDDFYFDELEGVLEVCPTCEGSGFTPADETEACPVCDGDGEIAVRDGTVDYASLLEAVIGTGVTVTMTPQKVVVTQDGIKVNESTRSYVSEAILEIAREIDQKMRD